MTVGGRRSGEYSRTIEMLVDMMGTGKTKQDVAMLLYFLHDSQYGNLELGEMADLIMGKKTHKDINNRKS